MLASFLLFGTLLQPPFAWGATQQQEAQAVARLKSLEAKLKEIEMMQNSMLREQDAIVEEIKTLKVWVNKRR